MCIIEKSHCLKNTPPVPRQKTAVWDDFWAGKDPHSIYPPVTRIVDEVQTRIPIKQAKVLEVGAGTGRDSITMCERGADVCILDYSRESLRLAKASMHGHTPSLLLADAVQSPITSGYYDIVFHQGLLEHFKSPYRLLRENHRVLKKGGFLVVDVPQTFHIYTLMKHALMAVHMWFAGWERQFTLQSLARLLKKCGFEPMWCYGDWSRPGIWYKILREMGKKAGMALPMYPRFFGPITQAFYRLQERLRKKRLFMYTTLSIGIIAKKI
jgi:ubiquinone/menaquinone biosynthesis C-methylase UbiE